MPHPRDRERFERWLRPLMIVAIFWLAWAPVGLIATTGLDASWQAGLAMAVHQGLAFGRDVAFTYGPLGFLSQGPILYFGGYAALGLAYVVVLRLFVAGALYLGARQSFGPVASFVLALLAATLVIAPTETAVLVILALWALRTRPRGASASLLAVAVGGFAALELLIKISVGVGCLVVALILLLGLPGRPWARLALAAVAGAVVFLIGWLGSGQPLSAIPAYIHAAEQIAAGYTAAMSLNQSNLYWLYGVALTLLAVGLVGAWSTTTGCARRQRVSAVIAWLAFWFFAFKEGFVRAEAGHISVFLEAVILASFGLRWARFPRTLALLGMLLAGGSFVVMLREVGAPIPRPAHYPSVLVTDIRTVLSHNDRVNDEIAGRAIVRAANPLDARSLQLLSGHTVEIFPFEEDVAWAYGLDWRPSPVLQGYSAYTPWLDHLDASFFGSSRAPQRILLQPGGGAIDGRVAAFDQPEATRELMCSYRTLHVGSAFAVLGRRRDVCSPPRLVHVEVGAWGRSVPVPAPPDARSVVLVRVTGVQVHGLESVRAALWKPVERTVLLDGQPHRFIQALGQDGLLLRGGVGLDFPAPFSVIPQAATIGFVRAGAPGGRPIVYRFYTQNY